MQEQNGGLSVSLFCKQLTACCLQNILPGKPGGVVHTFNPSTQEAEAGGSLWVQDQPGLHSEFQDSQGCYTEKSCLEKKKKQKQKQTNKQNSLCKGLEGERRAATELGNQCYLTLVSL